jgi:hypothetical protein
VASCASSSAFDTASAAPTLELNRSGAIHREPAYAVHGDHHAPFHASRLDHRRRYRIRAATQRDNNRSMQQTLDRHGSQRAPDLKSSPMRARPFFVSGAQPCHRALRSRTIPIAAQSRISSRAFVQSGFNEVAWQALAEPSRERDLTEPSRFPNQIFSDS